MLPIVDGVVNRVANGKFKKVLLTSDRAKAHAIQQLPSPVVRSMTFPKLAEIPIRYQSQFDVLVDVDSSLLPPGRLL